MLTEKGIVAEGADGAMNIEVINKQAQGEKKGSILFVHGACHGAWCWERFMEYFSCAGYDCYAMSFRGHGKSEGRERIDEFGFAEYVEDMVQVIDGLPEKPIVVAHSLGGMVLERFLGEHADMVSQAVLLNAMFPDGTSMGYQVKLLLKHFKATKVMLDINGGKHLSAQQLKDGIIFSGRVSAVALEPYADLIQAESKKATADQAKPATSNYDVNIPVHVIGSKGDWMFPDQSENAAKYGTQAIMLEGVCHDAMLDPEWEQAAEAILKAIQ